MSRYFCTIALLLSTACCFAQVHITGIIQGSPNTPLPYSTVALTDTTGTKTVKGTITDDKGLFIIAPTVAGLYRLRIQHTGYRNYISAILTPDTASQQDMGVIILQPADHALAEVAVKAQRPVVEFKNGRIILNVENDLLANGNTVLELLKRLPGVVVDAQNNVTVDGRGGVGFMMDGRLQQIPTAQIINILSSMNAESVASIELIKNPSAKYDAAGTSGLINIISKKVKIRGFSGNVIESAGYGKRAGSASALSLNYKTNKLTLFTNTSYANKDMLNENSMDRILNAGTGNTIIKTNSTSEALVSVLNFKGGLEYEPGALTTIGFNITDGPNTTREFVELNTHIAGVNPIGYNYLSGKTYNPERYNNPSANVYAIHTFDTTGTQLKFSADYTIFSDHYTGLNRNRFYNDQAEAAPMLAYDNHIDLDFRIFTQKLDFTTMLGKTVMFEAGGKTSFVRNNNNSSLNINDPGTETYHPDPTYANRFDYKEQILAGYVNITKALAKGSLQAGLRGEQTSIDAVNNANDHAFRQQYFNLFPNVSLDYALSQKNSVQFTYSYRIDRPAYNQLNPIKVFNDALNYSAGNPELKPQYSHKINLELNYNNQYHLSLAYTHTDNSIYNYSFTRDGSSTSIDTSFNFAFSDQLVLGSFVQYQFTKWYNMQAMGNFMYGNRRGIIDSIHTTNNTLAVQASMNNSFSLPKNFRLQVNATYTSPYHDGIQKYEQRATIDIAIQKKLLRGRLNATLGVYDLFYTDHGAYTSTLPGQYYAYTMRPDTRRVRLTLNYRFGNMKIDRKVNDNEDKADNRIKKGR